MAAVLVCAGAVAAFGGTSSFAARAHTSAKPPVVIWLESFNIPGLDFEDPWDGGSNAAAKYINAHGGFGGRQVVIDDCNGMLSPAADTACANSAIAKHPLVEEGCDTSWGTTGLEIFAASGIPSIDCTNSYPDYHNKYSFGIGSGSPGEETAMMKYLCKEKPKVKTVAYIAQADPEQEVDIPKNLNPIAASCGKTVSYTWVPYTAVDYTPYVTQILQSKPDFIMTFIGGTLEVQVLKALQSNSYPGDQVSMASNDMDKGVIVDPAGSAMYGAYITGEFWSWATPSNPDVALYLKNASSIPDYQSQLVQWGWLEVMWIWTAAKHIGFSSLTPAAMEKYLSTANNVPIPMSRTWVNPGPKSAPAVKVPYVQILQDQNGKFVVQTKGTNKGWISGFGT